MPSKLQQVLSCHLHMSGSHKSSLLTGVSELGREWVTSIANDRTRVNTAIFTGIKFTKQQWVSESVSEWVTDKHNQWSDSGPIKRTYPISSGTVLLRQITTLHLKGPLWTHCQGKNWRLGCFVNFGFVKVVQSWNVQKWSSITLKESSVELSEYN